MANDVTIVVGAKDQSKKVVDDVQKNFHGLGTSIGDIAKTAAGVFTGGLLLDGVAKLGGSIMGLTEDAKAAQLVMAQTNSVIKSTGGAAGLTADQVADLAGSLSKVTPFEDEVVQSAENMLLTFTKIGKDIFPQVTETVLDMSQALGQDTSSSAIQLGKALNDPIKGVTALQRVGVTFTAQQKEQIKAMVESGNVMGAQKVILAELQTEFGGSARAAGETFAGKLAILNTQIGNVKEAIGNALIPVLSGLLDKVMPIVTAIGEDLPDAFAKVAGIVGDISTLDDAISELLGLDPADYGNAWEAFAAQLQVVGQKILDQLQAWGQAFIDWIGPRIPGMIEELGKLYVAFYTWLYGTALPGIVEQLAKWGAAFIEWVGPQIPPLLAELGKIYGAITEWAYGTALPAIIEQLGKWGQAFIDWILPRLPGMLADFNELLGKIGDWLGAVALPAIVEQLNKWSEAFLNWIGEKVLPELPGKLADILVAIAKWQVQAEVDLVKNLAGLGKSMIQGLINGIASMGSTLWTAVTNLITENVPEPVRKALGISSPSKLFMEFGKQTVQGYIDGVKKMAAPLASTMNSVADNVVNGLLVGMGGVVDALDVPFNQAADSLIGTFIDIAQKAGRSTQSIAYFVDQLKGMSGNYGAFADRMAFAGNALNIGSTPPDSFLYGGGAEFSGPLDALRWWNRQTDDIRANNSAIIAQLATMGGYKMFEDASVAIPGTVAYDAGNAYGRGGSSTSTAIQAITTAVTKGTGAGLTQAVSMTGSILRTASQTLPGYGPTTQALAAQASAVKSAADHFSQTIKSGVGSPGNPAAFGTIAGGGPWQAVLMGANQLGLGQRALEMMQSGWMTPGMAADAIGSEYQNQQRAGMGFGVKTMGGDGSGGGMPAIQVTVQGNIISEGQLVDAVERGLVERGFYAGVRTYS